MKKPRPLRLDFVAPVQESRRAGIALCVVAPQRLPRAHALPGKPELSRKQRAQLWRILAGAGAAQHVVLAIAAQGDRRSAGARNVLGAVRQ